MEVRQRHLCGRHQVQVPLPRDLEEIRLELRQVARARQRGGIHQERRLHLGVAVLARVQREHEVDQRPRHPGARAHQEREPRTGRLHRALEIDDAEGRPEVPVRLGLEVERPGLAHPAHLDVVRRAGADRHLRRRQVGDGQQQRAARLLDRLDFRLQFLDPLAAFAVGREHRARVAPFLLGPRDLLPRPVLLLLEALGLRDDGAAARLDRGELLEIAVGVEAPIAQAGSNQFGIVADEVGIEHGAKVAERLWWKTASWRERPHRLPRRAHALLSPRSEIVAAYLEYYVCRRSAR